MSNKSEGSPGDEVAGPRRSLLIVSMVMIAVTLSKPTLNGGSIGLVSLIDFRYPGTLFGLGTAVLAYLHWRYTLTVSEPFARYRDAVIEQLARKDLPPQWLQDHLRGGGVSSEIREVMDKKTVKSIHDETLVQQVQESAIDHWCSAGWKGDGEISLNGFSDYEFTCRVRAFPGFEATTAKRMKTIHFKKTASEVSRPTDTGGQKQKVCEIKHHIEKLPVKGETRTDLSRAHLKAQSGDKRFSDDVFPHHLAKIAWAGIVAQSGAYALATWRAGMVPDRQSLIYELYKII